LELSDFLEDALSPPELFDSDFEPESELFESELFESELFESELFESEPPEDELSFEPDSDDEPESARSPLLLLPPRP